MNRFEEKYILISHQEGANILPSLTIIVYYLQYMFLGSTMNVNSYLAENTRNELNDIK